MNNIKKLMSSKIYKIPKEIKKAYYRSMIERNTKLIIFGSIIMGLTNILCLYNVIFLSKSGLTTLNNKIYAIFYLSMIVVTITACILTKINIKNYDRKYLFHVFAVVFIMLWGVLFSAYEISQEHTDKMMMTMAMFFGAVTFIRLKLKHYVWIISIMSILTVALNFSSFTIGMVLESFSMMITTMSIPIMFYLYDARQFQNLQEIIKTRQEFQKERNRAIEILRLEKHDQRHHNRVLSDFVKNGQTEKFFEYIKMQDESIGEEIIPFCENDYANSVLKSFLTITKEQNIEFEVNVAIKNDIILDALDITTLLSNILENAVHGCENSEMKHKKIIINAEEKNDKLIIKCTNTSKHNIKFNKDGIPQNENREGVGALSIKTIAKKYKGHVEFSVHDNLFDTKILLNI